jgi:hypothetical protein
MGYSGAWGELIHEKNSKVENLVALSLKVKNKEANYKRVNQ